MYALFTDRKGFTKMLTITRPVHRYYMPIRPSRKIPPTHELPLSTEASPDALEFIFKRYMAGPDNEDIAYYEEY